MDAWTARQRPSGTLRRGKTLIPVKGRSNTVASHRCELVEDAESDVKLNTTLGAALIGCMVIAGIGWMALPSLQASQRRVNADAAIVRVWIEVSMCLVAS